MSAIYNDPGFEMKKALYGEVLSLKTYYELLKKVKSKKEMTHLLKIIDDDHNSINFWKNKMKLHDTTNVYNLSEWQELERYSGRALSSINKERVATNLLQQEEIKLNNYKRLMNCHSLDSELKEELEKNIIPMKRNHSVLIENLFWRRKK